MDVYSKQHVYSLSFESSVDFKDEFTGLTQTGVLQHGTSTPIICGVTGARNPSWRQQIRSGSNATTSMFGNNASGSGSFFTMGVRAKFIVTNPYKVDQSPKVRSGETFGTCAYLPEGTIPTPDPGIVADTTNRCLRKFLEDCQSKLSSLELGQDLGEYKETLHSIHRPLGSMQDKLLHYLTLLTKAKRKIKNPVSLRKVLTDTYLEFRFGINPLVPDVAAIIASAGHFRFPVYPVEASATTTYAGDNQQVALQSAAAYKSDLKPTYTRKSHTKYQVRYKGAIRTNASSGKISSLQDYRLLPTDFLPTAWDLIPYSWMVDYFVNIGDIISALSFPTSNLAWGCKTIRNEQVVEYSDLYFAYTRQPSMLSPPFDYGLGDWSKFVYGGSANFKFTNVDRSKINGFDLIPSLRFNVPSGKYPYLNMLAVASQRFSKLVPFY